MGITNTLLALVGLAAVLLVLIDRVVRPQTGPLALAAVVEPYLLLIGAVAAAVVLIDGTVVRSRSRSRVAAGARLAALITLVAAIVVLGGEWWSPAPAGAAAAADTVRVLTWNLEVGSRPPAESVAGIAERPADLVAVQELTPDVAAAIEADAGLVGRYPYRILEARAGTGGVGLLSRLPLVRETLTTEPVVLRAGLLLRDGRRVEVLDVHPYPPAITRTGGFPSGLDTRRRDDDLVRIRSMVDAIPDPAAVLVVGDLNTAASEPGRSIVADGLRDAHAEAGAGTGFTWRPSSLEWLGLGFLRIDAILTGTWLRPTEVDEDCHRAGDHCRLYATLAVEADGGR